MEAKTIQRLFGEKACHEFMSLVLHQDLSKAVWLTSLRSRPDAATAVMEGYGREIDPVQLDRWTVYHAGMMLVFEAENTLRTDLSEFDYLTSELQRAVAGASDG